MAFLFGDFLLQVAARQLQSVRDHNKPMEEVKTRMHKKTDEEEIVEAEE